MEKITLYTNPYSRGRIIRWLLEECGADYEVVPVPFGENGTKSADYLAVNPMGKLPAVKYGDAVITETAALITFLAELFPEKKILFPNFLRTLQKIFLLNSTFFILLKN